MSHSFPFWNHSASVASVLLAASFFGCSHNTKQAIIYARSADPNATNGTAFDRGTLPLEGVDACVVPAAAEIEKRKDATDLTVCLEKALGDMSHPGERRTIDLARAKMGVAYRRDGGKLMIAKYGEFSHGEGHGSVSLRIIAPVGLRVERLDPSLEMPSDREHVYSPLRLRTSGDAQWCEVDGSPDRWKIVHTSPDRASMQEAMLAERSQDDE